MQIVYLLYGELSKRESEKFGIDYFIGLGYEVQVWYCYPLIHSKYNHVNNPAIDISYKVINSYKILKKLLIELPTKTIFIDFIVGLTYMTYKEQRIFRLLKIYDRPFIRVSVAPTPTSYDINIQSEKKNSIDISNIVLKFISQIKRYNVKGIFNVLLARLILKILNHTDYYRLPEKCFSIESDILQTYLLRNNMDINDVVPIHTFDHDNYIDYVSNNEQITDNICVFIDNMQVGDPYASYLGWKEIDANNYFKSLNDLFSKVEKELGLKVIIAAHQRSDEISLGPIGHRPIIKGKTIELVAKSKLVICHDSTAINFPVLFKKPILLAGTSDMKIFTLYNMAKTLGIEIIMIDDIKVLEKLDLELFKTPNANYQEYLHRFIKSKNAPSDKKIWEIIEPEIKNIMDKI